VSSWINGGDESWGQDVIDFIGSRDVHNEGRCTWNGCHVGNRLFVSSGIGL
jgi:hypothetical protein